MFFSIVIPTYNRSAMLSAALESVLAQTFTDYEVLVADDGSTDNTPAVAEKYGVRLLRQSNQGPGAARNLGINEARGEYVAFLDSDDIWFPWTLRNFHDAARRDSKPGFIIGQLVNFSGPGGVPTARDTRSVIHEHQDYLSAAQSPGFELLTCSSVCVRRDELLRAGGFASRNMNGEDSDLWLRLGVVPGFAVIQDPPVCGYRRHAVSAVANLDKTCAGMDHLIDTELAGGYPGGPLRRRERIAVITRHARAASRELARRGQWRHAAALYRKTFRWHRQLGRWKYLAGFWPHLAARSVRP